MIIDKNDRNVAVIVNIWILQVFAKNTIVIVGKSKRAMISSWNEALLNNIAVAE